MSEQEDIQPQEETKLVITDEQKQNFITAVAGDLFKDVDFSGLNGAIDKIAGHAGDLSKDEKDAALSIVHDWEKGVETTLRERGDEMRSFIQFFELNGGKSRYGYGDIESYEDKLHTVGAEIAAQTSTVDTYDALITAIDALDQFNLTKPEEPYFDPELSYTTVQKLQIEKGHEAELAAWNLKLQKLQRTRQLAEQAWKKAINEHSYVKDIIRRARSYNRNLNKFTRDVHEKTQLAKLNINIQSQEVREALHGLLDFKIKVQ